jgi:hypothetical protein
MAEWRVEWDRVSSGVPTESDVSSDDTRATCEAGLALVQKNRVVLLRTPDPAIDDTVADWLQLARTIYFDCPPPRGFPDAYATLSRLEAEIDEVIAIDLSEGDDANEP